MVWGELRGVSFQTFHYAYDTQMRDANGHSSTTTHRYQVTWIALPGPAPDVRITPDNSLLRALSVAIGKDVDTESAEFNRLWRVRAVDAKTAHAVLAPTVIARLLSPDAADRSHILQGERLMSVKEEVSDLHDLYEVVSVLAELRAAIPAFNFGEAGAH